MAKRIVQYNLLGYLQLPWQPEGYNFYGNFTLRNPMHLTMCPSHSGHSANTCRIKEEFPSIEKEVLSKATQNRRRNNSLRCRFNNKLWIIHTQWNTESLKQERWTYSMAAAWDYRWWDYRCEHSHRVLCQHLSHIAQQLTTALVFFFPKTKTSVFGFNCSAGTLQYISGFCIAVWPKSL